MRSRCGSCPPRLTTPRRGCKASRRNRSKHDGGGRERDGCTFDLFRKVPKVRFSLWYHRRLHIVSFRLRIKLTQMNLSLEGDSLYCHSSLPCELRTDTRPDSPCRCEVRHETERKQDRSRPDIAHLLHLRPRYALGGDKSILLDGRK